PISSLFTDIMGDLHDIGSGNVFSPLLMNADTTITDPVPGSKIFGNRGAMGPVLQRMIETGKLPEGRNALFLSDSQVNTPNKQMEVLRRMSPSSIIVIDEYHKAGGESNTGAFFQEL